MPTAQLTPLGVGIHNVLIATDFSKYSNGALNLGLELAHAYQAEAYVAFVVPTDEFLLAGPEAYVAAREAAQRDLIELKAELKRTCSYIEGKDYHLYLLEGGVAQSLLDFAKQKEIDLIVVGTHGRSGLGKVLMGSVAERVFRQSPVPVLTIGPRSPGTARAGAPRNILLPVEFTPASERPVKYAASLAREHHAKLTVLHVVKKNTAADNADDARVIARTRMRLSELVAREAAGVSWTLRVEAGSVVPTILHTADQIEADLLVLGVRSSIGILDRLMWPHAYEIVRESRCPVVTVREKP